MGVERSKVGVVVVNWNSFSLLSQCLDALDKQTYPIEKIIVVDNCSQNIPSELPVTKKMPLEYIWLDKNTGFAHANNLAISKLENCEWIALVNPDAFPSEEWLEKLVLAIIDSPNTASVSGPTLIADSPEFLDGAGDSYHFTGIPWRKGHGLRREHFRQNGNQIFSVCAAAALYRRTALVKVGCFDEDFFCYCEDVDLGFRLRLQGYDVRYIPDATTLHVGSATSGDKHSDFALYHGHRNLVWTYVKNMPSPLFEIFLPTHILMTFVVLLYFSAQRKGTIIFRAKMDALKRLPAIWKKRKKIQQSRILSSTEVWRLLDKSLYRQQGKIP